MRQSSLTRRRGGRCSSVAPGTLAITVVLVALCSLLLTSAPAGAATYTEQEASLGANTFSDYHNASGFGPRKISPNEYVQVSCKVYDPYIQSVNPDGYWYRISSSPWDNSYYAAANTFWNGDVPGHLPYTHNTDRNVPDCGAPPPPPLPPPPSVSLAQGPAASVGYWYAIELLRFPAGSDVSVSCYDSVSPGGFRSFSVRVNGAGNANTQNECRSNDGPDHWVVANGVSSAHIAWSARRSAGSSNSSNSQSDGRADGQQQGVGTQPPPALESCKTYDGVPGPGSNLSEWLLKRFEGGYSSSVVVSWSYFSANPAFVEEAKSIDVGQHVVGWRAVFPSDMYFALGHFTIYRDSPHCYHIYDVYDFDAWALPFWLQQKLKSAIPFNVWSSGWIG